MPGFRYQAYNKEGLKVDGVMHGSDIDSISISLKGQGLVPILIEEESATESSEWLQRLRPAKRIGFSDVEFFSSELSILLRNGVKVDRALAIVLNGARQESLKRVLEDIYSQVRRGVPLSDALNYDGTVFDSLYVSLVSIGEKTGKLAEAFGDLEKTLKFRRQVASKIRQAVAYPTFILCFCIVALIFIFNFIIPKFSVLFEQGTDIPYYTRLLLDFSLFLRSYQLPLLGSFVVLFLIGLKAVRTDFFKGVIDFVCYKLPGLSAVTLTLENLRFASAMKILLKNNVLIDEALGYAIAAVGNRYFRARIRFLQEDIKKGKNLSDILSKTYFFPPSFINLIEVGEHSGNTAEIFQELEDRFRLRFEEKVTQLTTFIEPVLILLMGVIVGGIVIMMLLSIVSLQDIKA